LVFPCYCWLHSWDAIKSPLIVRSRSSSPCETWDVSHVCWNPINPTDCVQQRKPGVRMSNPIPWRIHGDAIYGNMDPINIPQSC
jgi:hypothetical protein